MRGDTFDMVIFGGAGDLATRKLIPALYYLNKDGQIQGSSRILCTGRSAMDQAAMRDHAAGACRQYVRGSDLDDAALRALGPGPLPGVLSGHRPEAVCDHL